MSKKVNWSKVQHRSPLGKAGEQRNAYRDKVAKSYETYEKQQEAAERLRELEPLLKKALLEKMTSREPIKVLQPFNNLTETFQKASMGGRFDIGSETIPAGTELVFEEYNKTLGQFFFKSQNGAEYAIYATPTVNVGVDRIIPNSGLQGLLSKTSVFTEVMGGLHEREN